VLGLVLAPVTAPAMAGGMSAPAAMSMAADDPMADMDCCPPEQPAMPDCMKACPLLTLCLAKSFPGLAAASAAVVGIGVAATLIPGNDAPLDSLAHGPPPRPPQA
jgi:hypothetical protein